MKTDFLQKVDHTIEKYRMAKKSDSLTVGLSGGADSVALLLSLIGLGFNVEACHVNHCLRGEESDGDELFCQKLCSRLGVELIVHRIDVKGYCKANSLSTEEGARVLRYKAFEEHKTDKICTAHNLDDCLETTVFNLTRGSGLKGVASIPPVRGRIIRPLINCSRAEIESFLEECGQDFVTDSTNLEDEYSRNKIRHRVVPALKELNPSLMKTYAQSIEYLREDSAFLDKLSAKAYQEVLLDGGYSCEKLAALDYPIRRRVLMTALDNNGVKPSAEAVQELDRIALGGGKANVKANFFAATKNKKLYFFEAKPDREDGVSSLKLSFEGPLNWQGRKIRFEIVKIDGDFAKIYKMFTYSCLDYDKIKGELVLRKRQAGDKLQLVNRSFRSDLRVLMKDKFAAHLRDSAVILADDEGVVLAEKCGAADRVKLDEGSRRALVFYVSD